MNNNPHTRQQLGPENRKFPKFVGSGEYIWTGVSQNNSIKLWITTSNKLIWINFVAENIKFCCLRYSCFDWHAQQLSWGEQNLKNFPGKLGFVNHPNFHPSQTLPLSICNNFSKDTKLKIALFSKIQFVLILRSVPLWSVTMSHNKVVRYLIKFYLQFLIYIFGWSKFLPEKGKN